MTDSKSNDHWNFLARQLGAVPDTGPEEETRPPEPAEQVEPPADVAESSEPSAAAAEVIELQPEPAPAEETTAVWQPVTPSVPTPPAKAPAPPRAAAPKPKARNHWRELASTLGIEITEPEPEEPEVAEEAAPIDVPTPVAPPEHRAPVIRPPEPMGRAIRPPEPTERDFDAGSRGRSDSRREHRRHSLFDDPDLSLDTPGVLDAVFDEIEPPAMAEPKEIPERRQPEPFEDEFESRDRFAPKGLDDLFPDEAGDEEAEEAVPERVELGESLDTEDEEKRARRRHRPRRRRRSGRRDQEPAEEGVREAEKEEFEEEDVAEPRGSAAPVRDSRAAEKLDEDEELEDEERFDGDEEDGEEGSGERLQLKHKKIPTWQQAVDAIIAVNMESRAKNPSGSGGGGRGRGRRWRK